MLESIVERTILQHQLIAPGDKIGLALSGGVDSMVMGQVLFALSKKHGFRLAVLHFEHGMRGQDSLQDMAFVRQWAERHALPFFWGQAPFPPASENAARQMRMAFFEKTVKAQGLSAVATAHHANDLAETMLMHLFRGCGLDGLCSFSYRRGFLIRPLLDLFRNDLAQFAQEQNIAYREDCTNASLRYTRNAIRHNVLPAAEASYPGAVAAMHRAQALLSEDALALNQMADAFLAPHLPPGGKEMRLPLADFSALPKAVQRRVLRRCLGLFDSLSDISKAQMDAVLSISTQGSTGKFVKIKQTLFLRQQNELIISSQLYKINNEIFPFSTGVFPLWGGRWAEIVACHRRPESGLFGDADAFFSCVIRTRRPGDRFRPFGMQGSKSLKKWMIDAKIPRHLRDQIPLVARGSEILVIGNCAASELVRTTERTRQFLAIHFTREES